MALVAFLRGVNVGGHRRFRPSLLATELKEYGVVNIGAAGTLVVRQPGPQARFRAELLGKLPFETDIVLCDGRRIAHLEDENPFGTESIASDIVRFVSILPKTARCSVEIPFTLPVQGQWLVRLVAAKDQFVFGMYRRHMKTIGYLGQIDRLFGGRATTRNWNTILAIIRVLNEAH